MADPAARREAIIVRRSLRAGLIGAVVVGLCAWPAAAAASGSTLRTSGTDTYWCANTDYTTVVRIDDTYSRTITKTSVVNSVDVLTNTVTGESIRYVSSYKLVSDPDGYSLEGPRILDRFEPDLQIYYLKGHASIPLSAGGYAAFLSADEIIDVCAALGVYP